MNIDTFVREFADQFDDIDTSGFSPATLFKENDEWSSMTALAIIAMVDDAYSVRLNGDDIRGAATIKDIYDIVARKAQV